MFSVSSLGMKSDPADADADLQQQRVLTNIDNKPALTKVNTSQKQKALNERFFIPLRRYFPAFSPRWRRSSFGSAISGR
jgi:hypothetical protein